MSDSMRCRRRGRRAGAGATWRRRCIIGGEPSHQARRRPDPTPRRGIDAAGDGRPAPASGGLNPIFNTLSPPGTAPACAAGIGSPGNRVRRRDTPLPHGSANEQFNHAFGLVKQADYPGAEVALKAFVDAHPNDPLAGNAQYWLGETYFARNKFPEAATAFAEGYRRYPERAKAPEDLLYLGMSLAKADQKKNACLALAQLDQAFPSANAADQGARQRREKAHWVHLSRR
jgi:tol-pal system protein YbgF